VILRDVEELEYKEIAQILNVPRVQSNPG